jgi:hypothetical protein
VQTLWKAGLRELCGVASTVISGELSRGEVSPSLQPGPKLPVLRYPLYVDQRLWKAAVAGAFRQGPIWKTCRPAGALNISFVTIATVIAALQALGMHE